MFCTCPWPWELIEFYSESKTNTLHANYTMADKIARNFSGSYRCAAVVLRVIHFELLSPKARATKLALLHPPPHRGNCSPPSHGYAVQYNFRCSLLVPSMDTNIS